MSTGHFRCLALVLIEKPGTIGLALTVPTGIDVSLGERNSWSVVGFRVVYLSLLQIACDAGNVSHTEEILSSNILSQIQFH